MSQLRLRPLLKYLLAFVAGVSSVTTLTDETITNQLPRPDPADFDIYNGPLLSPILIPRVSGTEGSAKVLQHFVNYFKDTLPSWTIEFQNSTSKTPTHGTQDVPFVNFIAKRDPPFGSSGNIAYLTLVAHYDSKYEPHGFIGATDSAAPCAMIMHAVRSIDAALTNKWDKMVAEGFDLELEDDAVKGIQVLFLDGEEAFKSWTDTDSLYGARSLAAEWDKSMYAPMSTFKNRLNSIDLFVLLDLLGSSEYHPIPSWMQNTHWIYQKLAEMELRLRKMGLFKSKKDQVWLPEKDKAHDAVFHSWGMEDDHVPFVRRGVSILHLIPSSFPTVWHTMKDDGEHLDLPTVEDWALLVTAFVAEYLDLEGHFDAHTKLQCRRENTKKSEL